MARLRTTPLDHPAFSALPVQSLTLGDSAEPVAIHIRGTLDSGRPALVCIAGYHRNMTDFTAFVPRFRRHSEALPVVLLDLRGRGRSADRRDRRRYNSLNDAHDLSTVLSALGIDRAILLGQGYGGQVVMALAAERPRVIAGAILIDSGPMTDSRGVVRLRNNMKHVGAARGSSELRLALRQILAADYPGIPGPELDALAGRTHALDSRGKAVPLFDSFLIERLQIFGYSDVLVAQWPLFEALGQVPLLMLRTQLTDQLRRETFDEMMRRRPDATALVISGQGSPALLDHADEVDFITDFVSGITARRLVPA